MTGPGEKGAWPGGEIQSYSEPKKETKMQLNFDATKIEPNQGMPKHPVGNKIPASISEIGTDGKDETGYFFVVFTTQSGQIRKQYNLWTKSTEPNMLQMVDIANRNLSALCHATGIFRLGDGRELIGARCCIDVTPQAKKPEFNEVSKVYDAHGNEPGKAPVQATNPAQNGGWNNQPAQPSAQPPQQGWSNPAPAQNNAPSPAAAPANTWSQGPSAPAGAPPPWASGR